MEITFSEQIRPVMNKNGEMVPQPFLVVTGKRLTTEKVIEGFGRDATEADKVRFNKEYIAFLEGRDPKSYDDFKASKEVELRKDFEAKKTPRADGVDRKNRPFANPGFVKTPDGALLQDKHRPVRKDKDGNIIKETDPLLIKSPEDIVLASKGLAGYARTADENRALESQGLVGFSKEAAGSAGLGRKGPEGFMTSEGFVTTGETSLSSRGRGVHRTPEELAAAGRGGVPRTAEEIAIAEGRGPKGALREKLAHEGDYDHLTSKGEQERLDRVEAERLERETRSNKDERR